jgi:2,3,4,5-tetrahydropyridine-2,6-dicarboxylate N-succinyltransferase
MEELKRIIETAYLSCSELTPETVDSKIRTAIKESIGLLNQGIIRVAEKKNGRWLVHDWVKQAILLYFRINPNQMISLPHQRYYDKIPSKYCDYTEERFKQENIRIVPNACIRYGSFVAERVILMPCFVNIGAYISQGSMIDTWATVGSCAQIGKNVHLSGGVGIGGVLEPLQARPTIIEDHCFIGARSEIVEGVIVEENCVISMGVFISQSTPIYNRKTDEIIYGRVPIGSVVVAGSLPSKTGRCHLNCAVIIKQIDAKTRAKTEINQLLRDD